MACTQNLLSYRKQMNKTCDSFCMMLVWNMTLALAVAFLSVIAGGLYGLSDGAAAILGNR